jgi:hypothetical protein
MTIPIASWVKRKKKQVLRLRLTLTRQTSLRMTTTGTGEKANGSDGGLASHGFFTPLRCVQRLSGLSRVG